MTPEQQQQYRDLLAREQHPPNKNGDQYEFQRGWNAAMVFAAEQFNQVTKEKDAP